MAFFLLFNWIFFLIHLDWREHKITLKFIKNFDLIIFFISIVCIIFINHKLQSNKQQQKSRTHWNYEIKKKTFLFSSVFVQREFFFFFVAAVVQLYGASLKETYTIHEMIWIELVCICYICMWLLLFLHVTLLDILLTAFISNCGILRITKK